jgi:hypothetical protein
MFVPSQVIRILVVTAGAAVEGRYPECLRIASGLIPDGFRTVSILTPDCIRTVSGRFMAGKIDSC